MLDPDSNEYSEEEKERILQAYRERGSKSAISRIFGTGRNTLSRWLTKRQLTRDAEPLAEQVEPPDEGDVLELDECWTYVRKRSNKRWLRAQTVPAHPADRCFRDRRSFCEDLCSAVGKNSIGVSRKAELQ